MRGCLFIVAIHVYGREKKQCTTNEFVRMTPLAKSHGQHAMPLRVSHFSRHRKKQKRPSHKRSHPPRISTSTQVPDHVESTAATTRSTCDRSTGHCAFPNTTTAMFR